MTGNFFLVSREELPSFNPPNQSVKKFVLDLNQRILSWWRKGLDEKDLVNSLTSYMAALDLLSNQFKTKKKQIRTCAKCGYQSQIAPGLKQKVESLLIDEIGYTHQQFSSIWETRNKLSHGGFEITADNLKGLHKVRQDVALSIIKGMKKLLGLDSTAPPVEVPPQFAFGDPLQDIDYLEPDAPKSEEHPPTPSRTP